MTVQWTQNHLLAQASTTALFPDAYLESVASFMDAIVFPLFRSLLDTMHTLRAFGTPCLVGGAGDDGARRVAPAVHFVVRSSVPPSSADVVTATARQPVNLFPSLQ